MRGSFLPPFWIFTRLYGYSFQGQESDDEVKGKGNSYSYTFRMHDPRIGRFFAIDPLASKYPHYTPYQFSGNRVTDAIELEGLEEFILINNGTSYTIVWDITARGRMDPNVNGGANQTGTIIEVNTAGTVINGIRPINAQEAAYNWISTRRGTRTPPDADKNLSNGKWRGKWKGSSLDHDINGNSQSGGYPSTGFINFSTRKIDRELTKVPLDFNVPPPPPAPLPAAPAPTGPVAPAAGGAGVVPQPPAPTLNIQFVGGTAIFLNPANANAQVAPLAAWLNANPTSTITLTGNTGGGGGPVGTGPAVWAAPGGGTGLFAMNIGQLQQARAAAVQNLLTGLGIAAGRINTQRGTNSPMPIGRNVGVSTP